MNKKYIINTLIVAILLVTLASAALVTFYDLNDDAELDLNNAQAGVQSFTIGVNGTNSSFDISGIGLKMRRTAGSVGTMNISIMATNSSGAPNDTILLNASFDASVFPESPAGAEWKNFTLTGFTFQKGVQYALVVSINGSGAVPLFWRYDNGGEGYLGGETYTGDTPEAGPWNFFGVGRDFMFQIFGDIPVPTTIVTLNEPSDKIQIVGDTVRFNATIAPSSGNTTNATLFIWNVTGDIVNQTVNEFSSGDANQTDFTIALSGLANHTWNVFGCVQSTVSTEINCTFATANRTFTYGIANVSAVQSSSVYETQLAAYNISFNVSQGVTPTGTLNFNGTSVIPTITNIADNFWEFTVDQQTAIGNNTKNLVWEIDLVKDNTNFDFNSTRTTQGIGLTNFSECLAGPPQDVPYINFTFQNETSEAQETTATIASTFTYTLGDGSINKTLLFTSATEQLSYAFCFSPPSISVNTRIEVDYNNAESQQRSFLARASTLTNSTLNQKLFLLPTLQGLFGRYKTITTNGDSIAGVLATVTRVISGSTETIFTGETDDSGLITIFLNPDFTYDYVFSKVNFPDNAFSLRPNSADIYTVTMGTGVQAIGNGTTIARGLNHSISPVNSSLNNNTEYTFRFAVNSSEIITLFTMNLTNTTGGQLAFNTSSTQGTITNVLNTANNTRIIGKFFVQTATESFTFTKIWTVGEEFVGDYSIFRQGKLFLEYEFSDFIRHLLLLSLTGGLIFFLSANETLQSSESKIAVAVLMLWAFSILGWMDTGLVANTTNPRLNDLTQFSSQYGLAILTTFIGIFFWARRVFIRRI